MPAKTPFLEAVAEKAPKPRGCAVANWQKTHPDVTDDMIREGRERYSLKATVAAMRERGYLHKADTVSNHLKGECPCRTS